MVLEWVTSGHSGEVGSPVVKGRAPESVLH